MTLASLLCFPPAILLSLSLSRRPPVFLTIFLSPYPSIPLPLPSPSPSQRPPVRRWSSACATGWTSAWTCTLPATAGCPTSPTPSCRPSQRQTSTWSTRNNRLSGHSDAFLGQSRATHGRREHIPPRLTWLTHPPHTHTNTYTRAPSSPRCVDSNLRLVIFKKLSNVHPFFCVVANAAAAAAIAG